MKKYILSGNRPTGRLHIGHLFGVLNNWNMLQDKYDCFFEIADWHALTTKHTDTENLKNNIEDMVIDWLISGISPEKSTIFVQSHIKQHAELHILFSMIVTLSRLLRNPTLKEYVAEKEVLKIKKEKRAMNLIATRLAEALMEESEKREDVVKGKIKEKILELFHEELFKNEDEELPYGSIVNYGFLGYPVLQAVDILIYRADAVPIGKDQLPHLELTREIAKRFNKIYGEVFPIPGVLLSEFPKVPGIDGRKMSKSYENTILIAEPQNSLKKKIMSSYTDPSRIKKTDPGHPAGCPIFHYHKIFNKENAGVIEQECRAGKRGCVQCKQEIFNIMNEFMEPLRASRAEFEKKKDIIWDILRQGEIKAREQADSTMKLVRKKMHIDY